MAKTKQAEAASRKRHTRRMFAWRRQVGADQVLTSFQFRVAYLISEHVFHTTDCAQVSQPTLVEETGRTLRGVQKALYAIRDRGHMRIEDRSRQCKANRYWPILVVQVGAEPGEEEHQEAGNSANPGSHFAAEPREPRFAQRA